MPATPAGSKMVRNLVIALVIAVLAVIGMAISIGQGDAASQPKPTATEPVAKTTTEAPKTPTYAPTACAQKKGPSSLGALKPVKPAWRMTCMSLERQPAYVVVSSDGSQTATPNGAALVLECRTDADPFGCFKSWIADYKATVG
jgi:uncharacterized protein YggE